ncbi:hypothetical protein GCM10009087_09360 [Sphingomonas oligophenolica]|uniref:Uncharacterized protein n=1 Tax=Sphingomonas oligophenolica TaxID=301154 RepID=A0ABU9XXY2_9SPHN
MKKTLSTALSLLPFAYLTVYIVDILDTRSKLDRNLNVVPQPGAAIEDIVGFGFWPTWVFLTTLLAVLCGLSYCVGRQRQRWYWAILALAFVALTSVDAIYADILETKLLGR